MFASFAEDHLSTLRTGRVVKRIVENHACPHWADRPISEIRRADVIELIRSLRKDAPIGANRLLAYLKTFFSWAVDQDLIDASPAASVKKPSKENQRDRVRSAAEIRAIWLACGGAGPFGRAIRLMLATGQRRAEVSGLRWSEIEFQTGIWSLPRERTKADRAHVVPLTDLALSIIEESPRLGEFVFATGRSSSLGKRWIPISGWGKAKKRIDKAAAEIAPGMAEWHLHDLRRTCATYLAELGTDRIVISKILNHAEGGATGLYDRHRYDQEKKQALDAWAERLADDNQHCGSQQRHLDIGGEEIVAMSSNSAEWHFTHFKDRGFKDLLRKLCVHCRGDLRKVNLRVPSPPRLPFTTQSSGMK